MANFLQSLREKFFPPIIAPLADYTPTRYEYYDHPNLPTVAPPDKTPTPMPTQAPQLPPRSFDFEPYRVSGDFTPPPMPDYLAKLVWDMFPNEATKAALTLGTENLGYNPNAYNYNSDGTGDYGMAQINSGTLADFLKRKPNTMRRIGVSSVEDLRDIVKNLQMAKLIREEQGWGAWYGPKNRGFDIAGR